MKADQLLPDMLALAVPLWIDEIRDWPPHRRRSRAMECSMGILESPNGGAELQYAVKTRGDTAFAFNRLAEGIACAAYQPGGIKCFGLHFEAQEAPRPCPPKGRRRTVEEVTGL